MSFGKAFGEMVKRKRAAEGLTQQALAVMAFGDESYKTRISELENSKVSRPQAKTIDALIVALNISDHELNPLLNESPHPRIVDGLVDFFDLEGATTADIDVSIKENGTAVLFHNRPFKVEVVRLEYFVEEQMLVFLEKEGRRRPVGLPLTDNVHIHLVKVHEILAVHVDASTLASIDGFRLPLKVVE